MGTAHAEDQHMAQPSEGGDTLRVDSPAWLLILAVLMFSLVLAGCPP